MKTYLTDFKILLITIPLLSTGFGYSQIDSTQKAVTKTIDSKKSYYVEPGSYGTKRESDPPAYVKNLAQSEIKGLEKIDWLDLGVDYRARLEYRKNDIRRSYLTTDTPLLLRTRAYIGIKNIIDPFRILTRRGNNEHIKIHKLLYFNALTIHSLSVECRRVNSHRI